MKKHFQPFVLLISFLNMAPYFSNEIISPDMFSSSRLLSLISSASELPA
jgi:hypothetical protein